MTAVFLVIWFYIYAGLMFSAVSISIGLFPGWKWYCQVLCWSVLTIGYLIERVKINDFVWFIKYQVFKLNNR